MSYKCTQLNLKLKRRKSSCDTLKRKLKVARKQSLNEFRGKLSESRQKIKDEERANQAGKLKKLNDELKTKNLEIKALEDEKL